MPQKQILVVDNDPDTLEILKDRLESYGFAVVTASDGLEASKKLRKGKFHGVLLDIMMPVMDGMETLRAIREDYPELPVIMITASTSKEHASTCLEEGAQDYLLKPLNYKLLKEKIEYHFDFP